LVSQVKEAFVSQFVSLYEAKTRLSGLVDRAAAGEEIIIAKNGVPQARLVPIAFRGTARRPANAMHIRRIAADFDAPDPAIERLFEGRDD
jgi:prevent-host-death family protein